MIDENAKATDSAASQLGAATLSVNAGTAVVRQPLYRFGHTSLMNLTGVKPQLVTMANAAISVSTQDFGITDGVRTRAEQQGMVKRGVSKTMQSMHLIQSDGFGWAIDATPFRNGQPVWDWQLIYGVTLAMATAADQLGIAANIRWGGAWDRRLSDFKLNQAAIQSACQAYGVRMAGHPFLDGPHYEWVA